MRNSPHPRLRINRKRSPSRGRFPRALATWFYESSARFLPVKNHYKPFRASNPNFEQRSRHCIGPRISIKTLTKLLLKQTPCQPNNRNPTASTSATSRGRPRSKSYRVCSPTRRTSRSQPYVFFSLLSLCNSFWFDRAWENKKNFSRRRFIFSSSSQLSLSLRNLSAKPPHHRSPRA